MNDLSEACSVPVYLGLGSNLGDRLHNVGEATRLLGQALEVNGASTVYETEPVGYADQPLFLNAVISGRTCLNPVLLLRLAKNVEGKLGRRPSFRDAPRVIDVDILLYGDFVLETPDLTVPHPELPQRAFALVPLAEIAPEVVHPVLGKRIRELLASVDTHGVRSFGRLFLDKRVESRD